MMLGGPVLYLVGESLFRIRVTGAVNAERLAAAGLLVLLVPVGAQVSALALSAMVVAPLTALALWELRAPAGSSGGRRRSRRRRRRTARLLMVSLMRAAPAAASWRAPRRR
jgi:hypothetical protein